MRIHELMSEKPQTIEAGASCHDAIERMVRHRIRHLPVTDAEGRLVGVVTDRDIRHHLFAPGVFDDVGSVSVERLLKRAPVSDVMSAPAVTVGADEPLEEAARRMAEGGIGSLPVVDRGRVVGILTETDLLRRIVGADACCGDVETIVVSYP